MFLKQHNEWQMQLNYGVSKKPIKPELYVESTFRILKELGNHFRYDTLRISSKSSVDSCSYKEYSNCLIVPQVPQFNQFHKYFSFSFEAQSGLPRVSVVI